MSRSSSFGQGAAEHHGPTVVHIPHSPEAVEVSRAGDNWFNPGRPDIPLQIHELPHELRERAGIGNAAGAPIDVAQDPRIPAHVYHVTTQKPAVLREGLLRASGGQGGGLGGHHAPVVSLTTDRRQAMQIHKDLKFAGATARTFGPSRPQYKTGAHMAWGRRFVAHLQHQAHQEGWDFSGAAADVQLGTYSMNDWMTHFHMERSRKHPQRTEVDVNPVLIGEHWQRTNPANVGIVRVSKANIARTGALVTDFDLRKSLAPRKTQAKYGMHEIRVHGDVPL